MITITIPFIPFLFAIFAFMIPIFILIDDEDRILAFFVSTIFSIFFFFAAYVFFMNISSL